MGREKHAHGWNKRPDRHRPAGQRQRTGAVAKAIAAGGVSVIEFTMTTPGALRTIEDAHGNWRGGADRRRHGAGCRDGARGHPGGREFIVAPTLSPKVIEMCHRTTRWSSRRLHPHEILTPGSWGGLRQALPAEIGGPAYLKPCGRHCHRFAGRRGRRVCRDGRRLHPRRRCGAGVGSNLVNKKVVAEKRFDDLTAAARALSQAVHEART